MNQLTPPASGEYGDFFAGYIQRAMARSNVLAALPEQIDEIRALLGGLTDEQALFRDAPKEWSIKEVMGHLNDTERVFAYRLLCISRNDKTPLPGFDQEEFVREAGFDSQPLKDLIDEFDYQRRANILAIRNMDDTSTLRIGTASGIPTSARALIHMLVGHVDHHLASLREKYLPGIVK